MYPLDRHVSHDSRDISVPCLASAFQPTPSMAVIDNSLSQEALAQINDHLRLLTTEDILKWGVQCLPDLYQTTAFGLSGLVAIDMLSKITSSPPTLIFVDTLYHFQETLDLVEQVKDKYHVPINVFRPEGCNNVKEFEEKYGERLWERDESLYDYAVKVCL